MAIEDEEQEDDHAVGDYPRNGRIDENSTFPWLGSEE